MNNQQVEKNFFYHERDSLTRYSAYNVLSEVIKCFGTFQSVLDIGCGVGTWLSVGKSLGATRCLGLESQWIQDNPHLVIKREEIRIQDLEDEWHLDEKFSLGICLEVAEHLSESAGARVIEQLSKSCDCVVFSAAIPGQGGNGHINEQWPAYWQNLFAKHDMEGIDCIRPIIWSDEKIPWWYRQNIIVFVSHELAQRYYENLFKLSKSRITLIPSIRLNPPVEKLAPETNVRIPTSLSRRVGSKIKRFMRQK